MKQASNCESCSNYCYDDEYDEYFCQIGLDEDEMAKFLMGSFADCPYYMFDDEYALARKQ